MSRSFTSLLLVFLTALIAAGQAVTEPPGRQIGRLPSMTFPAGKPYVEVPFDVDNNRMVIPITVNGKPLRYILDTGASGAIHGNPDAVEALGLKITGEAQGRGAGGGGAAFTVQRAENVRFEIAGIVLANGDLSLRRSPSTASDGVIGRPLLANLITEVDWEKRTVRFYDPATFKYSGPGKVLPLTFDAGGRPYTEAVLQTAEGKTVPVKMVVDTGGAHALMLELGGRPEIKAPAGAAKAPIAIGASGVIQGFVGREKAFQLGGFVVKDVPVMYPDASGGTAGLGGRDGNLGAGVLRRFKIIYDYPGRRMIVEPNKFVNDPFGLNLNLASLETVPVPAASLPEYVGRYGARTVSVRDGNLYYQRTGGPGVNLRPIGKDQFSINNQVRITFGRDAKGTVTEMVIEPVDREKEVEKRELPAGEKAAVPDAATGNLTSAEREVLRLEREWLDAYEKYDSEAMTRIVSDDFKIVFPGGRSQTKADILAQLKQGRDSGRASPKFFTEDVKSRVEGDAVVLSGRLVTRSERGSMQMLYTDTYKKRDGRWQVVDSKLARAGN